MPAEIKKVSLQHNPSTNLIEASFEIAAATARLTGDITVTVVIRDAIVEGWEAVLRQAETDLHKLLVVASELP